MSGRSYKKALQPYLLVFYFFSRELSSFVLRSINTVPFPVSTLGVVFRGSQKIMSGAVIYRAGAESGIEC